MRKCVVAMVAGVAVAGVIWFLRVLFRRNWDARADPADVSDINQYPPEDK